jgi:glutaredoxin
MFYVLLFIIYYLLFPIKCIKTIYNYRINNIKYIMIEIVYLQTCPYCMKALDMLKKHKLPYKAIKVISESAKQEWKQKNKMSTFPQIFDVITTKNGETRRMKIGGSDDLEIKLDTLIKKYVTK